MDMNKRIGVGIFVFIALWIQCAIQLAGDVTETGNATVAGIVLSETNTVVPGVRIYIYTVANDEIGSVVCIDTIYGKNDGTFRIILKPARYCLEFADTAGNTGALTDPFEIITEDTSINLGTVKMESYVTYKGLAIGYQSRPLKVFLGISPYRTDVDSSSRFAFSALARRGYPVLVEVMDTATQVKKIVFVKQINLSNGGIGKDDTLSVDNVSLTLSDFERYSNQTKIGPLLGGGYWDVQSDGYTGGSSKISRPLTAAPTDFSAAIRDGGQGHKLCLQVLFTLGTQPGQERKFPFVYAGMYIGKDSELYNLSAFDSLCFYAKGNGKIRVEFLQEGNCPGFIKIAAAAEKSLTADWQRLAVTPQEFVLDVISFSKVQNTSTKKVKIPNYTEAPKTWADMKGAVLMINFLGVEGNEFWLDSIELFGTTVEDLLKANITD